MCRTGARVSSPRRVVAARAPPRSRPSSCTSRRASMSVRLAMSSNGREHRSHCRKRPRRSDMSSTRESHSRPVPTPPRPRRRTRAAARAQDIEWFACDVSHAHRPRAQLFPKRTCFNYMCRRRSAERDTRRTAHTTRPGATTFTTASPHDKHCCVEYMLCVYTRHGGYSQ